MSAFSPLDILSELKPKERLNVAQFAEKYRYLSNVGGGHVGLWENEKVPYLTEPMECLTSFKYLTVALVGPGQSGKTEIGQNWLMHSVATSPGDFLWFMQSDDSIEAFVKTRINKMIDSHDVLKSNMGQRPIDDSLHYKRFMTMTAEFLTATEKNLINKSAPRIVADEIDAYSSGFGNVKPLLDVRRQTFGLESKLLLISHPDRARGMNPDRDWTDGIMGVYADSDRRIWYCPCPHCNAWSSPCPMAERYMTVDYPADGTLDEIEENAVMICPVNGCIITEKERIPMMRQGRWIGTGQEIAIDGTITGTLVKKLTAGFWVVGVMSPFILGGIGALARARVKAEREYEVSGEDVTLRQVMVKQWGIPFVPPRQLGSVSANDLVERTEHILKLRVVPRGVRFITAAWDVQIAHFDVLVRGWGEKGESWIIDHFRVSGDTAADAATWDKMIDKLLRVAYPLEGIADKMMPIRGIGFDSGGAPGVTRQAYDAWLRWRRDNRIRSFGLINGRDAWSAIPLKGATSINAHRLTVTYPDTSSNKNRKASKGTVPIGMFNPNNFKDDLSGQLQRATGGAWCVHFPAALKSKEPPHEFFEQLVSEHREATGRWEKNNRHIRNEVLDLMVMTHVVAHLHGISQINWKSPPAWAAEWESNSFLVPMEGLAIPDKKSDNTQQIDSGVKVITGETKKSSLIDKLAR